MNLRKVALSFKTRKGSSKLTKVIEKGEGKCQAILIFLHTDIIPAAAFIPG